MLKCVAVVLSLLAACGCSGQKQATVEDVKSQLTEAISLAAAAELTLERSEAGATPAAFRSADLDYLREQIDDNLKEFEKKQPPLEAKSAADECRDGLKKLRDDLSLAGSDSSDQPSLKSRIHNIRGTLQRAKASL